MDNLQVFLILILIRLIIPIAILFLIGEWNRFREANNSYGNEHLLNTIHQSLIPHALQNN